jgi:hypothetical protein
LNGYYEEATIITLLVLGNLLKHLFAGQHLASSPELPHTIDLDRDVLDSAP